ncbi:MAG: DUF1223 domain-containing protein [Pseudomonadota bacterium]
MKYLGSIIFAAAICMSGVATAEDNPVVVELYTSQGCSSCPPADALLHELADRDDVIALALHVDYWDYIGWRDPFGDPAHAERQRAYAAAGNRRTIYTPEMIVNGTTDIVGAKSMALSEAIATHARQPAKAKLTLRRDGDQLQVSAQMLVPNDEPLTVHLLRYTPLHKTVIKRGENAGHTYEYANVVEAWQRLSEWDGQQALEMRVALQGDQPAVVLVQQGAAGPIVAAARLRGD